MVRSGRSKDARELARPALLSALSLALLYLSSLVPGGRLGMVALAGLVPAAAVISGGIRGGLMCYAVAGILGVLVVPDKGCALLYLFFFGLYPVVKSLCERLPRWAELLAKLIFFNGMLSVFWFLLGELFLPFLPEPLVGTGMVYAVGNVAFLLYDFGFSKLIALYLHRVAPVLRK